MYLPELELDFKISEEVEDFAVKALKIFQEKGLEKPVRLYEPIGKSLNNLNDLKKTQSTVLKKFAKLIHSSERLLPKKLRDEIKDIWIPVDLENSVRPRAELMEPIDEFLKRNKKLPVDIGYNELTNSQGKIYKVWLTTRVRWGSAEQTIYWLEELFKAQNSCYNRPGDASWFVSLEMCSILLGLLAYGKISTPTPEEMLDNLASDNKPKADFQRSHLQEIADLKQQVADGKKREQELEKKLEEASKKISQQFEKIDSLENEVSLYSDKLEQVNIKSERIKLYFPLVDEFIQQIQKLCLKVASKGWDAINQTTEQIVINNSTPLKVQKYKNSENYFFKERWITNAEESFYFSETDLPTLQRALPTIFRCLLGQEPPSKGAFAYSKDFTNITLWLASKISSYNPNRAKGDKYVRIEKELDQQKEMFWRSEPLPLSKPERFASDQQLLVA